MTSFNQIEATVPGALGAGLAAYYTTSSIFIAAGAFIGAVATSLGYGAAAAHYADAVASAAGAISAPPTPPATPAK